MLDRFFVVELNDPNDRDRIQSLVNVPNQWWKDIDFGELEGVEIQRYLSQKPRFLHVSFSSEFASGGAHSWTYESILTYLIKMAAKEHRKPMPEQHVLERLIPKWKFFADVTIDPDLKCPFHKWEKIIDAFTVKINFNFSRNTGKYHKHFRYLSVFLRSR